MRNKQKLKSISVLIPLQEVSASISQLDFSLDGITTIVAEGKFWKRMLYVNGEETISVSEEIGDAYPKDPIITICGSTRFENHGGITTLCRFTNVMNINL
jgi:hypothetical protein